LHHGGGIKELMMARRHLHATPTGIFFKFFIIILLSAKTSKLASRLKGSCHPSDFFFLSAFYSYKQKNSKVRSSGARSGVYSNNNDWTQA
jgi:hypothetical protein